MANENNTIEIYQIDSRILLDEIDKSELTNPNVTNVEVILMSSLFVLTVLGNLIVIFILLVYRTSSSSKRPISRMSFYIINLSVADICVALMSILPATIWRKSVVFFSDLQCVCKLVSFSQVSKIMIDRISRVKLINVDIFTIIIYLLDFTSGSRAKI